MTPTSRRMTIRDTGIGIDAQAQKKLFGMFTKIKDARVRNPLGVGLGLAICKQLVEMMGGQIWINSAYGVGSTFSIAEKAKDPDGAAAVINFVFSPEVYGSMNSAWQGEWNIPLKDISDVTMASDVSPRSEDVIEAKSSCAFCSK